MGEERDNSAVKPSAGGRDRKQLGSRVSRELILNEGEVKARGRNNRKMTGYRWHEQLQRAAKAVRKMSQGVLNSGVRI